MDKAKALYEQPEIEKSINSVTPISRVYPASRSEALEMLRSGIDPLRVSVSKAMGKGIISYFQSQGMKNQLPSNQSNRVDWINRFHRELAIENPYWPQEIPFWIIYHYFIHELKYGEIQVRGANIVTHISAFKEWIRKEETLSVLEKANQEFNPNAQKQIQEEVNENQEDREIQAQGYVNLTPSQVKETIYKLEMMYGTFKKTIKSFKRSENYIQRLYNTREKMKTEGKL